MNIFKYVLYTVYVFLQQFFLSFGTMQDKLMTSSYSPVMTTKAVKDEKEQQILRDAHVRHLYTLNTTLKFGPYLCPLCSALCCVSVFALVLLWPILPCRSETPSPSSSCWCGWRKKSHWECRPSWRLQNTSTSVASEHTYECKLWGSPEPINYNIK